MIAVDANVVVRYLTADDAAQAAAARGQIDNYEVLLLTTVVLEAARVLRGVYHLPDLRIVEALAEFTRLPTVRPENPGVLEDAFQLVRSGMEFADALHVSGARDCESFVTFDRRLTSRARGFSAVPVRSP